MMLSLMRKDYSNIQFIMILMFKILRARNSAWDFLGVYFWSRDFLGFVGSRRDFFRS